MNGFGKEVRGLVVGIAIGVLVSSSVAFGYAKLNAWRDFGADFQLGYVVGYFDGVSLAKRRDQRSFMSRLRIPFERWRAAINKYYEVKTQRGDPLPTAMYETYLNFLGETYPEMAEKLKKIRPWRHKRRPQPANGGKVQPTPTPGGN